MATYNELQRIDIRGEIRRRRCDSFQSVVVRQLFRCASRISQRHHDSFEMFKTVVAPTRMFHIRCVLVVQSPVFFLRRCKSLRFVVVRSMSVVVMLVLDGDDDVER